MQDIRDVVIIVFGIGATVAALALVMMTFILYRKTSAIVDSAKATMNGVETFSKEVLGPVTRASSFVSGFWKVFSSLLGEDKKGQEDTSDGR